MEESEIENWYEEEKEDLHKQFDNEMRLIRDSTNKSKEKKKLKADVSEKSFLWDMDTTHKKYDSLHHQKMQQEENKKRRAAMRKKIFGIVFFPFKMLWIGLKFLFVKGKYGFMNFKLFYKEYIGDPFKKRFFCRWESLRVHGKANNMKRMAPVKGVFHIVSWPARHLFRLFLKAMKNLIAMIVKMSIDFFKASLETLKKIGTFLFNMFKKVGGGIGFVIKAVIEFIKKYIIPPIMFIVNLVMKIVGKGEEGDDGL